VAPARRAAARDLDGCRSQSLCRDRLLRRGRSDLWTDYAGEQASGSCRRATKRRISVRR
jgi:hypothetical protein